MEKHVLGIVVLSGLHINIVVLVIRMRFTSVPPCERATPASYISAKNHRRFFATADSPVVTAAWQTFSSDLPKILDKHDRSWKIMQIEYVRRARGQVYAL